MTIYNMHGFGKTVERSYFYHLADDNAKVMAELQKFFPKQSTFDKNGNTKPTSKPGGSGNDDQPPNKQKKMSKEEQQDEMRNKNKNLMDELGANDNTTNAVRRVFSMHTTLNDLEADIDHGT